MVITSLRTATAGALIGTYGQLYEDTPVTDRCKPNALVAVLSASTFLRRMTMKVYFAPFPTRACVKQRRQAGSALKNAW
jgi:hypothetical protein